MKFSYIILISFLALPIAKAADYSTCSEVFNRHGWGHSYYPFEPSKDGSVKPIAGVNNFKFDKETGTYIVEEKVELQEPYSQKKQVHLIIHQLKIDSNGNWISYESKDQNARKSIEKFKTQEARKPSKDSLFSLMPDRKIFNVSRKIDFKMQNDLCVPLEGVTDDIVVTVSPKVNGAKEFYENQIVTREFNTELCHDLLKFLEKNPQVEACFDPKVNMAIGELFGKYLYKKDAEKFGVYGPSITGIGIGVGGLPAQDLESQLRSASDKLTGKSPVITAHSILESCKWNPLASAAFNEKIWEKQSESAQAPTNSSSTISK